MSSELERFRDHCRKQSACMEIARPDVCSFQCNPPWRNFGAKPDHAACTWRWQSCSCSCHDADRPPPPTDADRLIWKRLADEIDAYLTPDDAPLWEDA